LEGDRARCGNGPQISAGACALLTTVRSERTRWLGYAPNNANAVARSPLPCGPPTATSTRPTCRTRSRRRHGDACGSGSRHRTRLMLCALPDGAHALRPVLPLP
jgi:hypothetical protein